MAMCQFLISCYGIRLSGLESQWKGNTCQEYSGTKAVGRCKRSVFGDFATGRYFFRAGVFLWLGQQASRGRFIFLRGVCFFIAGGEGDIFSWGRGAFMAVREIFSQGNILGVMVFLLL